MGSNNFWLNAGNRFLKAGSSRRLSASRAAKCAAYAESNCEFNNERNIRSLMVNDQTDGENTGVASMRLGRSTMGLTGSEVIAVYNALLLYGKTVSVAGAAKRFEENGYLVSTLFSGYGKRGANPYCIGKVLSSYGVNWITADLDQMCDPGIYILSYWKDEKLSSGRHTIAVHTRSGMCYMYNYTMQGKAGFGVFPSAFRKTFSESYITGYKLK